MHDPRIKAIAKTAVNFSVSLQRGEKLLIDITDGAEDFALALVEAAHEAGGFPYVNLQTSRLNRALILDGSEESWAAWYEYERVRMEDMDAYITVRRNDNPAELSDVPGEKLALYNKYYGKLHYGIRLPKTKWCVLRYPNSAMAQAAGMSFEAFEDFFFRACGVDYAKMNEVVRPLVELVKRTDRVRIIAPGTDISFSIKDQGPKDPICGIFNIPCGEVGFPVIPDSVNGVIAYNVPSLFQGFMFQDIRFRFEGGRIVEASSNDTGRINRVLDTDENARRIGEFAMSFNPHVTRPIFDTLFDEKMVKSIHFTPGNSPINPSGIHWDIVQSQDAKDGGGEIWFDGVLIRKDGLFVLQDLENINPEKIFPLIS
ncbi:peptidase M29, aminopeptidase II [Treponema primitia ZAS-2]|uniref:Peptidase M29, aminopeptidase II n=1 Tax=Treponema primitia (strain ATCC BAA-887 / DSM 12427 / ZAS-2) TaxID=545694 RepID=F5YNG1_TREPZ|nr:aminopeptidase [Treponema primitia]AEF86463.1 peptidase M29, aminopeptidase II [Treponema primitia ZAS-2]